MIRLPLISIFLISIFLFSCSQEKELQKLNTPDETWTALFAEITLPSTSGYYEPEWKWKFFVGNDSGWEINGLPKFVDYDWVEFPHRYYQPNAPFWYETAISESYTEPKWMYINADDGVQVFKNRERILAKNGFFYFLDQLSEGDVLTLRVINDAANGGVRQMALMDEAEAEDFFAQWDAVIAEIEDTYKALQHLPQEKINEKQSRTEVLHLFNDLNEENKSFLPWIRKYPWLAYNGDESVSLSFEAINTNKASLVFYKKEDSSTSGKTKSTKQRSGSIFTTELEFGDVNDYTHYYIKLDDEFKSGPFELNFRERNSDVQDLVFWSDCQGGWMRFDSIVEQILQVDPHLHIGLGDFVANGYFKTQWHQFFHFGSPVLSSVPGLFIPGNHDYDGYYDFGVAEILDKYLMNQNNESVRGIELNGLYLLGVDLNTQFPIGLSENPENIQKLEGIMNSGAWQNADWRILLVHHPAFGESAIGYGGEEAVRDVLRKANNFQSIDLVVSGHNHRYERGVFDQPDMGRFMQLTVGGAGRVSERPYTEPLNVMDTVVFRHHFAHLSFQSDQIKGKIIGTDGSLIDEFSFSKKSN